MKSGKRFAIALLWLCACAGSAIAQEWPHRALKLIVPFASGDANDSLAQALAGSLQQALGQGTAAGLAAEQALARSALFSPAEARELTAAPDPGRCPQMTDLVIARAAAARAAEPAEWP